MEVDYLAAVQRFSGFAKVYNNNRPSPPVELRRILKKLAGVEVPELVVDIGCGTGLSTRFWRGEARRVIGIDPSADMLEQARAATKAEEIEYRIGYGSQTGLVDACADIVTCSQAFHWMEPETTVAEVARILRRGGVLAIYDHEGMPVMGNWQAELAVGEFYKKQESLPEISEVEKGLSFFPKDKHHENVKKSGYFCYTRQFWLSHTIPASVDRMIGGILSHGQIQSLIKLGVSEERLGLSQLKEELIELLGRDEFEWTMCVQVIVGVK